MVKILYINHVSQISGAERVLIRLLNYLEQSAIKPIVVCPEGGKLVKEIEAKNIPVKLISMPLLIRTYNPVKLLKYLLNFISFSNSLKHKLRLLNIDIIHCNTYTATLYSILPAWLSKIPIIWHMHDILGYKFYNKCFIRLAALGVDKIICVSKAVKKNLVGFGVREEKCEVVYNSIYSEVPSKNTSTGMFRKEIGIDGDTKIISIIGQIAEWKGQDVFIDAASKLAKDNQGIKFIVVGDIISPMEEEYKEYIHNKVSSMNLSGFVVFTGFRDDVLEIMNDLDVIVHASLRPDPLPTVIIEAMKSGKPVVATNVGGVPEMVIDQQTGFILPPGDAGALAGAIAKLIENPAMARRMGIAGKKVVETKFSPSNNLSKVLKLYDSLISAGNKV